MSYADEQQGSKDAHPFSLQPEGFLIYEFEESGSGYILHCGIYRVDEQEGTVTHIPSAALLPNLINATQLRLVSLTGDRLTLRTPSLSLTDGALVTSRLEWQRALCRIAA